MKNIFTEFGRSLVATLFFAVILCGLYPLIVFGVAQLLFPHQANGSLLVDKSGAVRGSALLAQNFTGAQYFHPRPSAAGANGYDADQFRRQQLRPDLVQSGCQHHAKHRDLPCGEQSDDERAGPGRRRDRFGQRPGSAHQSRRTPNCKFRASPGRAGFPKTTCANWFEQNTSGRDLGILGEPRVNVMTLNFALDQLPQK